MKSSEVNAARGRGRTAPELGLPAGFSFVEIAQAIGLPADASSAEIRARLDTR